MGVNLSTATFGVVQLSDYINDEVVITQTGEHRRKVHSAKEQIQLQVNLFQNTSDNADLSQWRTFLKSNVTYNSATYVCTGYEVQVLNDKNASNMIRLIINLVKKGA